MIVPFTIDPHLGYRVTTHSFLIVFPDDGPLFSRNFLKGCVCVYLYIKDFVYFVFL